MVDYILSDIEDELLHKIEAGREYIIRTAPRESTDYEKHMDWVNGLWHMDIRTADSVFSLLNSSAGGLRISENNIHHLEHTTLEEYKSILSFHNWELDGRVVNDDQTRIIDDWQKSCNYLNKFMKNSSATPCNGSVMDYFKACCTDECREKMNRVKAYYLHLTFGRDHWTNYERAARYVDAFYNEPLIMKALNGNKKSRDQLHTLIFPADESGLAEIHSMASMMELCIFRIIEIV